MTRKAYSTSTKASGDRLVPWLAAEGPLAYTPELPPARDSLLTDELAKERGLDIEHDPWTRALWEATHQSFALRRWVSENKFGPHRVVCRTSLTNIRITTFFAGEHEVRVLDPSRVELLAAIGCEVSHEG